MYLLAEVPKITDWITAIAAIIGIPLTVWSFFKLITRDLQKENQIASLSDLAETQRAINIQLAEQISQLTKQTGEFQYQSTLMFDSNQILEKQLNLFQEFFLQQKSQGDKQLELELQKRRLEIKPHFIFNGGDSNPQYFNLRLLNKGATATALQIEEIDTDFAGFNSLQEIIQIDQGQFLNISGYPKSYKTYWNGNTVSFVINLIYSDIDGTKYCQKISRQSHQYIIDPPILRQ